MTEQHPEAGGEAKSRSLFTALARPSLFDVAAFGLVLVVSLVSFQFAKGAATLVGPVPQALLAGLACLGILSILRIVINTRRAGGPSQAQALGEVLVNATRDALVIADGNGRAIEANDVYADLATKTGQARLIGMDALYAGYPDFAEPVYQLAQAARAGESLARDIRVPAKSSVPGAAVDGPRWLRLSVNPVGRPAPQRTLWRLADITADRQLQENAFARLQYIITYLDHAPAGFFSTLPNGRVDYVNATLAEWLGLDLAEAQNEKMPLARLVGEEVALQLTAIEGGASASRVNRFSVKLPLRNTTGVASGLLAADIIHRCDYDGEGHALPARSMVLRRDQEAVTPARASGHAAGWFDALGPSAPIGLAGATIGGVLKRANVQFLSLSAQLKLQGEIARAIKEPDLAEFKAALAEAVAAPEKPVVLEVMLEDDAPRAVQLTLCRTGDEVVVFAVDRTQNKALEVQLAQSQKMQAVGQLASGIAHDFNNVLTPIIGFADLLLAKMRPTDAAFADIMNIKQNANRAANLVRQLLAFSRKQTMQPRMNLLSESMSDLGNLLGRVLGEKIGLEISHARDLGHVLVDFNQFEQVIINLAVNARDAMPEGGTLSVKTYNISREQSQERDHKLPEGEYVVCEVADTGSGIPKPILDKIWEPFFSTKDVGKGTGLGLSMVYGIVKQTGGFIYCDSMEGKGTVFTIYLPRQYPAPVQESATTADKVETQRADFTGRGRILVVEDEDSVRAFAVRALGSRGYTVIEADSGERALEVIEEDKDGFEIILSDVVMPEMDGPTMLAEMRKRGVDTKFIFMSGYAQDAFERNLENPDDFAFIQKPFSLKELLEKVKNVMGSPQK